MQTFSIFRFLLLLLLLSHAQTGSDADFCLILL